METFHSQYNNYIRFDWAIKRILRDKANQVVLEGLLSVLLNEKVHIHRFLESESNQETEDDKFNRVDMLAENERGELFIIEVQNSRELDYFHRILYGTSKAITEYLDLGDSYGKIKKVYSINIVYFELGQGQDYVYHGTTTFRGLHKKTDVLQLSTRQQELYGVKEPGNLFPEYYILRVNDFDKVAKTPLDEWMSFLKTGDIDEKYTAPGLPEAREKLRVANLSDAERRAYFAHYENLRYQKSVISTGYDDGRNDERKDIAKRLKQIGMSIDDINKTTGLSIEEIGRL